jgi:hypothetical protein
MNKTISKNMYKSILIYRYADLLRKTLKADFLELNNDNIKKIIKIIYESKFFSEIILSYDDDRLLKTFKYFAEKRKCIFNIISSFNKDHDLSYNFELMNLYVEYIIFFANIKSNLDVYNFYGELLINIRKYPLLYPEFILN